MAIFPEHLMTETITIEQASYANDAQGSPVATWSALVSNIPARVEQSGSTETPTYGAPRKVATWDIYTKYRTDIDESNRIKYTPSGGSEITLEVETTRDMNGRGLISHITARTVGGVHVN